MGIVREKLGVSDTLMSTQKSRIQPGDSHFCIDLKQAYHEKRVRNQKQHKHSGKRHRSQQQKYRFCRWKAQSSHLKSVNLKNQVKLELDEYNERYIQNKNTPVIKAAKSFKMVVPEIAKETFETLFVQATQFEYLSEKMGFKCECGNYPKIDKRHVWGYPGPSSWGIRSTNVCSTRSLRYGWNCSNPNCTN